MAEAPATPPVDPSRWRLAELLVPLSLMMDLAMGLPDEQAMRACLLATRLARRMGLPEPEVADVYYTTLLQHLGCTATAEIEAGWLAGDELQTRPVVSRTDFGRPAEMLELLTSIGAGRGPLDRGRMVVGMLAGFKWSGPVQDAVCEVATMMAARLGMPPAVQLSVGQMMERWDGKASRRGLSGEQIAMPARMAQVATHAVTFHALGGVPAALEAVRRSSGGWFDPEVSAALLDHGPALLAEMDQGDAIAATVAAEPEPFRTLRPSGLTETARIFADMADLKSTFTLGHSTGVARLVEAAAAEVGIDGAAADGLRLAALLHDLGRVGVPAGVWQKPGPVSASEWERIRLHPYYTERILARSPALAEAAAIAGMHHERLDGSGYHRGASARETPVAARLLAAADTFQAKTQARPHRPALSPEQAAAVLIEEARLGRLDPEVVACVVEAAGQVRPRIPRELPAGLSERELEVLRLVAAGSSNQEIADRLVISRRTAEHHVQHIYDKIGVSTRAGASVFAMEHDLLAPPA